MITLRMPVPAAEHVRFELSPLTELVQSWHVLAAPGHHALQLPWVRRCRDLPDPLRADLRDWAWVVRDYVPMLFEAGTGPLVAAFDDELNAVAALPDEHVAHDLGEAARVNGGPPDTDPRAALASLLDLADRYWRAAFAEEWRHLEPKLLDAVTEAGQAMPAGVLPMLGTLAPAIRVDRRAVSLDRPHDHRLDVAQRGPLRLTPSFYAWPHVRVTCDEPWPLRLSYPVVPPSPRARRAEPANVLNGLRALAAQPRLDIVRLLREQPRSTQELSGLLGMSGAAVSRHLRQLLDAGLVGTDRVGYYVLYRITPDALEHLAEALRGLG